MRVAIYTRVSTKEQSCEIQLQELNLYAKQRGYTVVGTYVDHVTGDIGKRKIQSRYDQLMNDAANKLFDCVLVWKYDRLARSMIHLLTAASTFEKLGIQFISVSDGIDTTTPGGKLYFHIMASIAEFERALIVERVNRGLRLIQDTGFNAKGEPVTLGRPEEISQQDKSKILDNYIDGMKLKDVARCGGVSMPTAYSIIRRSVLPCVHGKYRCNPCRKLGRIPVRLDAGSSTSNVARDTTKVSRNDRVRTP